MVGGWVDEWVSWIISGLANKRICGWVSWGEEGLVSDLYITTFSSWLCRRLLQWNKPRQPDLAHQACACTISSRMCRRLAGSEVCLGHQDPHCGALHAQHVVADALAQVLGRGRGAGEHAAQELHRQRLPPALQGPRLHGRLLHVAGHTQAHFG